MKYLNLIVTEKGFIPTKYKNHIGYVPINQKMSGLLIHDILDHGNNQDGSTYKELLAQGGGLQRTSKSNSSYVYLLNFISQYHDIPFIKYKPSKEFQDKFSLRRFKKYYKLLYVDLNYKSLAKVYCILAKGYDMAKRRKRYGVNRLKLESIIKEELEKNHKTGTIIKIPIKDFIYYNPINYKLYE